MKTTWTRIAIVAGLALGLYAVDVFVTRSTAKQKIRDANEAIQAGTVAAIRFREKAREVDQLLNERSFQQERLKLTTTAHEAATLAGEAEREFRRAADAAQRAIDLTPNEEQRAVWTLKRDSLLQRVEGAAAGREGYARAADESIADLSTLRARLEPFAQRAERARAEAARLNHDAKALDDAAQR